MTGWGGDARNLVSASHAIEHRMTRFATQACIWIMGSMKG